MRTDLVAQVPERSLRTLASSCGTPNHPPPRETGSPQRSTGSRAPFADWRARCVSSQRSCQHLLIGSSDPLGKPLTVAPLRHIVTSQPLDVIGQLGGGDLV